eukprot:281822-Prymnesium_polylepis.1
MEQSKAAETRRRAPGRNVRSVSAARWPSSTRSHDSSSGMPSPASPSSAASRIRHSRIDASASHWPADATSPRSGSARSIGAACTWPPSSARRRPDVTSCAKMATSPSKVESNRFAAPTKRTECAVRGTGAGTSPPRGSWNGWIASGGGTSGCGQTWKRESAACGSRRWTEPSSHVLLKSSSSDTPPVSRQRDGASLRAPGGSSRVWWRSSPCRAPQIRSCPSAWSAKTRADPPSAQI